MFGQILSIVLPVFVLVGIGYVAARTGILSRSVGEALGEYVYVIAVPVLLFRTLATSSAHEASPWALWLVYFVGAAVTWTAATLIVRRGFGREARAGVIAGMSAAFANTAMVGIPLISAVFGEAGLVPLFLILSVHMPVATVATAILMERAAALDGVGAARPPLEILRTVLANLATNPIVIAIGCSVLWRLTGLPVEGLFADVLGRIAATTLPVALLSLGMSMVLYGIRGNLAPGLILSLLKVGVMPALVYVLAAHVAGLPPLWVGVATLTAACPTGINAFIFANRYGTGHAMSANSITITTAGAVLTTGLWVLFLGAVVPL
ncbi:AEC family transporter [Polymorphum gilvum]|uniref:Probable ABC transporter, permease protein n=1 Tax=Polymorphum gilvum (strain LMG 25793 / CGMCC 1.9160 / SL003B-26A1) TaxID=991905 RepID=F2J0D8_POLGS|nr:AEC family transporter [Polymorphum gilvum]ADZ68672.1 probable ABC transporter, permease protein [Polymorphum gilvum SL003B-26A1]